MIHIHVSIRFEAKQPAPSYLAFLLLLLLPLVILHCRWSSYKADKLSVKWRNVYLTQELAVSLQPDHTTTLTHPNSRMDSRYVVFVFQTVSLNVQLVADVHHNPMPSPKLCCLGLSTHEDLACQCIPDTFLHPVPSIDEQQRYLLVSITATFYS